MAGRNWIGEAIKHPGSLRARLKGLRLVKGDGPIPLKALERAARGVFGPKTARRARTALTLRRLSPHGRGRHGGRG